MSKKAILEIHICALNEEKHIADCLNSFIDELSVDIHLAFLNDGSKDQTLNIVKNLLSNINPNFYRIINLESNQGLGNGKRLLAETSSSEYIACMDSDDICIKNRFKKQLNYLLENNNIDVCGGFSKIFDYDFSVNSKFENNFHKELEKNIGKSIIKKKVKPIDHTSIVKNLWRNSFIHSTIMMKRESLLKVGNYNSKLKTSQDYDLWLRMSIKGLRFSNMEKFLIYSRTSHYKKYNLSQYFLTYSIAKKYAKQVRCINFLTLNILLIRSFLKAFQIKTRIKNFLSKSKINK